MTSRTERAFESDSLQTLVHGIFAITMTLLILDLRLPEDLPEGQLSEALRSLAPQACAYALGFIYLMSNWLSYREMFRTARLGLDQMSTVLHLLAIGLISLTPFTVSLLARASTDATDLATAVRVMAVIVASGCLLSAIAARHDVRRGSLPDSNWLANPVKAYGVACGPSVLAFGLSFVLPWAAVVCLVADALLALLSQALYRPQSAPLDTVEAVVPTQAQPIELMKDATA